MFGRVTHYVLRRARRREVRGLLAFASVLSRPASSYGAAMTSLRATVAVLVLVAHVPLIRAAQEGTAPDLKTEQELRALRRELLDAIERGDRVALERILAPGFMFIHSQAPSNRGNSSSRMPSAPGGRVSWITRMRQSAFMEDRRRSGRPVPWLAVNRVAPQHDPARHRCPRAPKRTGGSGPRFTRRGCQHAQRRPLCQWKY
jgi:hypothetical protein